MTIKSTAQNMLSNKNFTYRTKGIFGAIVFTTILRGTSRPTLIMVDKKADPETRKYAAGKELLYQLLCLGLTFAMVIPSKDLALKFAKKYVKGIDELKGIYELKGPFSSLKFDEVNKDIDELTEKGAKILGKNKGDSIKHKEEFKLVKGALELASFVSSIVGLTIVAPAIGNKIIHPMLKKMGWAKEEPASQKIDAKA